MGLAMIENKEGVSPSFLNSGKWEINVGGMEVVWLFFIFVNSYLFLNIF